MYLVDGRLLILCVFSQATEFKMFSLMAVLCSVHSPGMVPSGEVFLRAKQIIGLQQQRDVRKRISCEIKYPKERRAEVRDFQTL